MLPSNREHNAVCRHRALFSGARCEASSITAEPVGDPQHRRLWLLRRGSPGRLPLGRPWLSEAVGTGGCPQPRGPPARGPSRHVAGPQGCGALLSFLRCCSPTGQWLGAPSLVGPWGTAGASPVQPRRAAAFGARGRSQRLCAELLPTEPSGVRARAAAAGLAHHVSPGNRATGSATHRNRKSLE